MTFVSVPAAFATAGAASRVRRALSARSCGPPRRPDMSATGFGRGKGGASRSRFGRGRRAALSLSLRSTSRRVVMKARVVRHHGARFRSATTVQAHHLFEARGRDARRRRRPDVRREVGCGGRTRLCRALRGRPPSFPLHHFSGGCRRARRSPHVHARADDRCRAGSRNQTGLDRGRPLEHRQSAYSCPDPRPCRGRPGSGHQPGLHQPRVSGSGRRARHAGARAAQRAGNPVCPGKGG